MDFRISHLRRSGGHVFAMWVLDHFDDASYCDYLREPYCARGSGQGNLVATFEDSLGLYYDAHVLRDCYNCMASRIKFNHRWHRTFRNIRASTDLWLAYASQPVEFVRYDLFVGDPGYRLELAHCFSLPNPTRNPPIDKVPDFGHGSSFTGIAVPGPQMKVHERYLEVMDDSRMRRVLADPRVQAVNSRHFGWWLDEEGRRHEGQALDGHGVAVGSLDVVALGR